MNQISREHAADDLREQAASCRRLAKGTRTDSGSTALHLLPSSSTRMLGGSTRAAHAGDGLPIQQTKDHRMTNTAKDQIDQAELTRLGIERIPSELFLGGGYRYTTARDAVAAAKRGAGK